MYEPGDRQFKTAHAFSDTRSVILHFRVCVCKGPLKMRAFVVPGVLVLSPDASSAG
jgi:hypothetical protein